MDINDFINLRLMSHPINWLFVWAVLLVIGFGWMVIHEGVNNQPAGNT